MKRTRPVPAAGLAAHAVLTCAGLAAALLAGAAALGATPGYRVFVSDEGSGELSVFDGPTRARLATIPLGKRPRGVAADPVRQRIYVALSGSPLGGPAAGATAAPPDKAADGVAVIDGRTLELLQVLRGSSDPEQLAVDPAGRGLYVASEDTASGLLLDATSGRIERRWPVGAEPEGIAVHPRLPKAYFTSEAAATVAVVATDREVAPHVVAVGERPRDVAVSPDGARVYVTGENDASLTVLDGADDTVLARRTVPGDGVRPKGVVVAHDGTRVYVSTGRGGEVVEFDAATLAVLGRVHVGERPWGIALSPDDATLYAANGPSNDVAVVATRPLRLVATLPAGARPWGVAVLPAP